MIISHEHKYLFIEIPLTASWAIRNELCEYYQGAPILHKHATYAEFKKIAPVEQQNYFIFATVRNPLDCIVSNYFKLLNDHKGVFSDPRSTEDLVADFSDINRYRIIKENNLDFEKYFLRFFRRPYSDMADLSGDKLDFVIRFEDLQNDFSKVLNKLSLEQVRPIPVTNKTEGKNNSFITYYSPRTIKRAKKICGPYMKKWGYDLPPNWGELHPTMLDNFQYNLISTLKYFYMINFRYSNSPSARAIKRLRAVFR